MTTTLDIKTLLQWSEPKEVPTKNGPRMLSKAEPTKDFWNIWKAHKAELKAAGVSCSPNAYSGDWEICWWQPLSEETVTARAASVEASRAVSADVELPHPEGFDYMPFQKAGIRYALDRKNALIADEMGLGKTIQVIGIINADPSITSALIICPKSLKLNWKRELTRWLTRPLSVGIVNGGWVETDIVVMNYEAGAKFFEQTHARTWGALILDEAHLLKNPKTQRSTNIKGRKADARKFIEEIAPIAAERHIRLTGTPIVNRPSELYNIISDLTPVFGSFFTFAKRYCGAGHNGYGWQMGGASNLDELQRRLRETIMVRRLKAEVLTELPAKIRQIVEVETTTMEMRRAVVAENDLETSSAERLASLRTAVELSKAESDEAYKAAVKRLREAEQVDFTEMARLRHETALAKIPALVDHIENALEDGDNKIIIAAHHHDVIDQLAMALIKYHPVVLTGKENETQRQNAVDRFQNVQDVRIFIGSITAAGVGITLTASSHVVFAELDWVPGNMTQMEDRAHRIGQTMPVLVQHVVLNDSLDARMAQILVSKQAVIDKALDERHAARPGELPQQVKTTIELLDIPDKSLPVEYQPKQRAATADVKPDMLEAIAAQLDEIAIATIQTGLRFLAGMDLDGARELNDVGFNKIDTGIGRSLAERSSLTPRQAALGAKLLRKYHRQLPHHVNETVKAVTEISPAATNL